MLQAYVLLIRQSKLFSIVNAPILAHSLSFEFVTFSRGFMAFTFFFQANKFLKQHCASSFATKSERIKTIRLVDKQLRELGFKNLQLKGLKPKHIDALLQKWQAENLSAGTIKNRMVHIRWLTEKIGKKGASQKTENKAR